MAPLQAADRPDARSATLAALTRWVAPDAPQERLRLEYLEHLRRHQDGLSRSGPADHLTASCVVLDHSLSATLLVLHGKARRWFQPGGHIESQDSDLRHAAAREAAEETGLTDLHVSAEPVHLDRHKLSGAFGACRSHLDVRFVAVAPPTARPVLSDESVDLAWFPFDRAPAELAQLLSLATQAAATAHPQDATR